MNLQEILNILIEPEVITILTVIEKVFTILAIAIGGLWVYYNFFRGRIYRPRLEPIVFGKLFTDDRYYHLQIISKLKNVGLSKVNIKRDVSAVIIYSYTPPTDITEIETAQWDHLSTFSVFEDHEWIESGEQIEDKILLSLEKGENQAFRADLRVVGHGISWKTHDIIYAGPQ